MAIEEGSPRTIDRLSSTGLCDLGDGTLARAVRGGDYVGAGPGEILIYDPRGVRAYLRVDDLRDPHDIVPIGELMAISSPATNSVLWIDRAGEVTRRWSPPGEGDAWHLNGLLAHDGRLLVSAFGRFAKHRGWGGGRARGAGILIDLESGRDVLRGLSMPHTPRLLDDRLLVCNSGTRELLRFTPGGASAPERVALEGFTRGMAADDRFVYVGESARRSAVDPGGRASVAVLDRGTLRVVDRVTLPFREVYDVAVVPQALFEGLDVGFRVNPLRTAEQDQLELMRRAGVAPALLWATGEALAPASCRVEIRAWAPERLRAGESVEVPVEIVNRGDVLLASIPPHPVSISFGIVPAGSPASAVGRSTTRNRLPRTLPPGEWATGHVTVVAPDEPGRYRLRVTLVQEGVAWFDDLDPGNSAVADLEVTAP